MMKKSLKRKYNRSSWKSYILPLLCIVFIASLMIFSKTAVNSAISGVDLWLNVVFPSIFPFMVASEVLGSTNFIRAAGVLLEPIMRPLFNVPGCASFPFAIGITSGYPVGAKVIASMKEKRLINRNESERLLAFCNNSSPLFIMGAVSTGMLKMPQVGSLLLICHIAAGISAGIIFKYFYFNDGRNNKNEVISSLSGFSKKITPEHTSTHVSSSNNSLKDLGGLLGNAVKNSIGSLLVVGGFIILFSVIINLLIESGIIGALIKLLYPILKYTGLPEELFVSLSSGIIEVTTGLKMLSSLDNISLSTRLTAVSAVLGWGGISVHMQIYSIISNSKLSIKPYLFGKLMQSIISAIYTFIVLNVVRNIPQPAASILGYFSTNTRELTTWSQYFLSSCRYLSLFILFFMFLIVIAIIMSLINHLLSKVCSTKKSK